VVSGIPLLGFGGARAARALAAEALSVRRFTEVRVAMLEILLYCVTGAAMVRCSWLLVGLVRVIPVHLRARTRKWGVPEVLTFLELPVFLALTALLMARAIPIPPASRISLVFAALGALLAVAGVLVSVWAIATTVRRRVILDAGHFVKQEHPLVTNGAYAVVRNPMYLGIILLWLGIAAAFQSRVLSAAAAAYVVPVLCFYIRAEERMMSSEFGAQFEEYSRRVGRLIPRVGRRAV
jgi:protein-S-isoprenylcysteine O-methyltransferase Ste14